MIDISGRRVIGRALLQKRVLLYEGAGFAIIIALIWANEVLDVPHLVLGSPPTKVNLREAFFESGCIAMMGFVALGLTWNFLSHIKYLEGFVVVCAFCRKVRVAHDTWVPIEQFVSDHAEVEFSHSFCPSCGEEHYGDFLRRDRVTSDT
jgi:hypothetical protein